MSGSRSLAFYFQPGQGRRRLLLAVFGVVICAFSVGLCRVAGFGVDPFQCLCSGLYNVIPLPQGLIYALLNTLLLLVVLVLNRHYIGLGTLINLFLFGYIVDFSERALLAVFGSPDLAGRIVYLILGMVVNCTSCAMYITADLGVSTYDAIALHMADRGVGPYRLLRIGTDVVCVAVGFLLGAPVGIMTLMCAGLFGPAVAWMRVHWFEPLLQEEKLRA